MTLQASLVAQTIKNLPAMQEMQVRSLGQKDPLEKGMATHSSVLAWRFPWTEEPGGLQSMELQRVGHNWATNTHTSDDLAVSKKLEFQGYWLKPPCTWVYMGYHSGPLMLWLLENTIFFKNMYYIHHTSSRVMAHKNWKGKVLRNGEESP